MRKIEGMELYNKCIEHGIIDIEKIEMLMLGLYDYYTFTKGYGAGHELHIILDEDNFYEYDIKFCEEKLPNDFKYLTKYLYLFNKIEFEYLSDVLYQYYSGIGYDDIETEEYYDKLKIKYNREKKLKDLGI